MVVKKVACLLMFAGLMLAGSFTAQAQYNLVETIYTDFYAPNLDHTYDYVSAVEFFTWRAPRNNWVLGIRIGTLADLPDFLSW
ncbi:hypothetical protein ACFLQW_04450, partial [Candidatus Zixiibacteriota bacterium]